MPPAVMRDDGLLKQRLDDATPEDNKWNGWPSAMEVVGFRVYDRFDPHDMHELGYLVGTSKVTRQVSYKVFDYKTAGYDNEAKPMVEIRRHLPPQSYGHYTDSSHINVRFGFLGPHGQEDDITRRNIYAIFDATTKYNSLLQRNELMSHGLVVTIGCKHDYSDAGSNHNRGYHKGECKRCGHRFMVDSSD